MKATRKGEGMKLKKDQLRIVEHLHEHGSIRGFTLRRGRPHDRRVLQSLIDAYFVKPVFNRSEILQDEYAIRGDEDKHGIALLVTPIGKTVCGATHYGVRVRPFSDEDYARGKHGSARQNGIDTAWECYPDDEVRREWNGLSPDRP